MKTTLTTAIALALGIVAVVSLARMDTTLGAVLAVLHVPSVTQSAPMSIITKKKIGSDGTEHVQSWEQQVGESNADFRSRAAREWAAYCADIGG